MPAHAGNRCASCARVRKLRRRSVCIAFHVTIGGVCTGETIFSGGLVAGTDIVDGAALSIDISLSSGYQGRLIYLLLLCVPVCYHHRFCCVAKAHSGDCDGHCLLVFCTRRLDAWII